MDDQLQQARKRVIVEGSGNGKDKDNGQSKGLSRSGHEVGVPVVSDRDNNFRDLTNPFESDLTWDSLRSLYQNCHHCVAVGNPLIKRDANGFPQHKCRSCGGIGTCETIRLRVPIDTPFDDSKVSKTGPCCQTMSGIMASAEQGCQLCVFLLKQLSNDELAKLTEPSRDGILRHVWSTRSGSSYKSFTYYYGCDQNDVSKYVTRKSVHFTIDGEFRHITTPTWVMDANIMNSDSAFELGLQDQGLESDEEAIHDIIHENNTKVIDGTTKSYACMALARRWLQDCQRHHKCYESFQSFFSLERAFVTRRVQGSKSMSIRGHVIQRRLPSRLLYLGTAANIRLCITTKLPRKTGYMTLSHCWGKTPTVKLEKHNLSAFQHDIPYNVLPQTFKDAILITRKWFRCQYLWIDSLCIVQDDKADWKRESALMGSIYAFSMLNIAATHGLNGLSGCFSQRDPRHISRTIIKPPSGFPGHIYEFMEETEEVWQRCVESAPLYQRGWVFQERILAPRTLNFCETQVIWGCHEKREFEGINGYHGKFDDVVDMNWDQMVEAYSRCALTRDEDKLVAISGLAQVKQPFIDSPYIAGLWEIELPRNLLWKTETTADYSKPSYPPQYRAPSWSWAAVNGPVSLRHPLKGGYRKYTQDFEDLIKVININIDHVNDSFGQVASGYITFKGGLTSLQVSLDPALSIIEGKHHMYKTLLHELKLCGESYFDVHPPCGEEYYGMPIMGTWKCIPAGKEDHKYIEGLLLAKISGVRGTFRRVGTFTAFEPYNGMGEEARHFIHREDYLKLDTLHQRGFQQYIFKVI